MKIEVKTKMSKLDQFKLKIIKELQRLLKRLQGDCKDIDPQDTAKPQEVENTPPTGQGITDIEGESRVNEQQNLKLHSFGSPNVGKCRLTSDAIIKDFRMDKKGMSYKWVKGGCEALGAKDKSDASATLAICGYSNDGINYHVTKFDWISTSRLTRSWENVYDHYNGIDPDTFFKAPHHCFFICDKHGNYRTNILIDK